MSKLDTTDLDALSNAMSVLGDPVGHLKDVSPKVNINDEGIQDLLIDHTTMRRVIQVLVVAGYLELDVLDRAFAFVRNLD